MIFTNSTGGIMKGIRRDRLNGEWIVSNSWFASGAIGLFALAALFISQLF